MQTAFQAAVNQVCAEKNIDQEVVIDAISKAIALAYKKDFGTAGQRIVVNLGDDITQMKIFEERDVVDTIDDAEVQIKLKEAKVIRPDAKVGDMVYIPIVLSANFGRIAAQAAKQVIAQKIQEAEREMLFEKFKHREGELLTARVQKSGPEAVLLEIEGVSTMLYFRDQIKGEKYFTGQRLRVLLDKVEQTTRGPQLRITRSLPQFITALFAQEIPEMRDGTVYVARIVREPGVRCKLAVASDDPGVDPVGAFVGQKGARINAVMEEVGDERLDVMQYYEDEKKMLLAALSPAKIANIEINDQEERVKIYVTEAQRAITIGKGGQNVRLAGRMIDKQVDVITYDGPETELLLDRPSKGKATPTAKKEISDDMMITDLSGIDDDLKKTLQELGLSHIKLLTGLSPDDLEEVGISRKDAETIVQTVKDFVKNG